MIWLIVLATHALAAGIGGTAFTVGMACGTALAAVAVTLDNINRTARLEQERAAHERSRAATMRIYAPEPDQKDRQR